MSYIEQTRDWTEQERLEWVKTYQGILDTPINSWIPEYAIDYKKKCCDNCEYFDTFANFDLIDPNIVYVCGELNRTNKLGLPNDLFAISSSKNIDLYSSIYTRLSEFRYKIVGDFVGENLVEYVLRNVNIEFCERDTLFVDVVRLNKS
jgi:hypothetical protein